MHKPLPRKGLMATLFAVAAAAAAAFTPGPLSVTAGAPYRELQSGEVGKRTRLGVKAFQRAAAKRRNQARHRNACRG